MFHNLSGQFGMSVPYVPYFKRSVSSGAIGQLGWSIQQIAKPVFFIYMKYSENQTRKRIGEKKYYLSQLRCLI